MGTTYHPSLFAILFSCLCIAPWVYLAFSAYRDRHPKPQERVQPYREIQPREMPDAAERAAFVQAKLEKIERASR